MNTPLILVEYKFNTQSNISKILLDRIINRVGMFLFYVKPPGW